MEMQLRLISANTFKTHFQEEMSKHRPEHTCSCLWAPVGQADMPVEAS